MKGKDIRLARLTGIVGSAFALGLYLFPAVGSSSSMQTTEISDVATGHSRIAKAAKVERAPEVDGEILSDPAWSMAEPIDGFWQTTPDEGKPSTQQTEVRIVYTSDTIYVGVVCYDEDPERIIISDSRRDASLNETDSFQLIFDTYDDHQNGFVFGTNPAGIEYDAQVNNEGEGGRFGGRQQRGTAAGFNINWDGSWEVRAKITQIGWCAEFAIPFRTLRYPRKKEQIWGLNFQRNIRRRNESAYWTRLPRQYNIQKLSEAGLLAGLEIPNRINLKLMPHLLGQASRNFVDNLDTDWDNDFGVDAKYSITPGLTLDLTYNTDFAQVEVDEEQINLDRFNLFFPEKRPFFLENSGIFAVGSPGEVDLFFSRRIGIGPDGESVPIVAGGRMSGKLGNTKLGFVNMQTESVGDTIQANNFGVARISREFPNRSSLGGIFVNRQGAGSLAPDDDYNRTVAADGRLGIGRYGQLSGFAARTWTPGVSSDQHAFKFGGEYRSEAWLLSANYTEVADEFNPEVGFLERSGFRKPDFLIFYTYRVKSFLKLHEMRPHISYRGFWGLSGFQQTGYLHVDNHSEWKNGYELHTGINFTTEGVSEAFEISDGVTVPVGSYHHREAQIVANTNRGAPLSFSTRITAGGFFGGNRFSASNTLSYRIGETFTTEIRWSRNDIDLPGGDFVTNLIRARLSYSFTPRIFVQSLIQYNNQSDIFSVNLRFAWLQTANTGLFVVYNESSDFDDFDLGIRNRAFVVKYNKLFDLFR
jgi:hypothetical protein